MDKQTIIRNSGKCLKCNEEIESVHRHDFKWCGCGNIFVDGGKAYFRRGGNGWFDGTAEDTSEVIYENATGPSKSVERGK